MEKERDEAKHEAKVARLAPSVVGDARVRVEEDLARVQEALAAKKRGRHKVKAETTCLEVERTSHLLELGAIKDEVSSLHSQAGRNKEAIEKEYQKALEVIFFKHNICEDHLEVSEGMLDSADLLPPGFFMNPRCPLV